MCCIFTCCGWMIDLVQRFWTFTMSCCISSAVCCALVTASMSGIALGYNYSLAEYIDLKETNVSVYLKRGVFDDEIADDMDWRRSGHMPVEGHLRDKNLMTGAPENEDMPLRAGRRMDDSMVVSDDQHKFEGSLMRLTVKPPAYKTSLEPVTSDRRMMEIIDQYPKGSLEQIKAIHSLMNMRKSNTQRNTKTTMSNEGPSVADFNGRRVGGIAPGGVPMFHGPYSEDVPYNLNQARLAVPDQSIGSPDNWFLPKAKTPETYRRLYDAEDYVNNPSKPYTYPSPIIYTSEMRRPTRPVPATKPTHTPPKDILREGSDLDVAKSLPEDEIQMFKSQLIQDKQNFERLQKDRIRKYGDKIFRSEEDYADQANKGLPIRKKREFTHETLIPVLRILSFHPYSNHINNSKNNNYINSPNKTDFADKSKEIDSITNNVGKIDQVNVFQTNKDPIVLDRSKLNKSTDNVYIENITTTTTITDDSYLSQTRTFDRKPSNYSGGNFTFTDSDLVTKSSSIQNLTLPKSVRNITLLNSTSPSTGLLKFLISSLSANL